MEQITEYDWAWRKEGPMTFERLYREGIEICSPELYLRWLTATIAVDEMFWHGLLDEFECLPTMRSHAYHKASRLVEQAFVRAYLVERRAGLLPRKSGPPANAPRLAMEIRDAVDRAAARAREWEREKERLKRLEKEQQRWRMFGAIWCAIGHLAAS